MKENQKQFKSSSVIDSSGRNIEMSQFLHRRPVTKLNWRIIGMS